MSFRMCPHHHLALLPTVKKHVPLAHPPTHPPTHAHTHARNHSQAGWVSATAAVRPDAGLRGALHGLQGALHRPSCELRPRTALGRVENAIGRGAPIAGTKSLDCTCTGGKRGGGEVLGVRVPGVERIMSCRKRQWGRCELRLRSTPLYRLVCNWFPAPGGGCPYTGSRSRVHASSHSH